MIQLQGVSYLFHTTITSNDGIQTENIEQNIKNAFRIGVGEFSIQPIIQNLNLNFVFRHIYANCG